MFIRSSMHGEKVRNPPKCRCWSAALFLPNPVQSFMGGVFTAVKNVAFAGAVLSANMSANVRLRTQ